VLDIDGHPVIYPHTGFDYRATLAALAHATGSTWSPPAGARSGAVHACSTPGVHPACRRTVS
jgi:hypothetical protein